MTQRKTTRALATKAQSSTTKATIQARLAKSQYGNPQPTIEVRGPASMLHRAMSALLHRIAATVEDATPAHEGWIVQIQNEETWGRVYLELDKADDAEAKRGMAVLEEVLKSAGQ